MDSLLKISISISFSVSDHLPRCLLHRLSTSPRFLHAGEDREVRRLDLPFEDARFSGSAVLQLHPHLLLLRVRFQGALNPRQLSRRKVHLSLCGQLFVPLANSHHRHILLQVPHIREPARRYRPTPQQSGDAVNTVSAQDLRHI